MTNEGEQIFMFTGHMDILFWKISVLSLLTVFYEVIFHFFIDLQKFFILELIIMCTLKKTKSLYTQGHKDALLCFFLTSLSFDFLYWDLYMWNWLLYIVWQKVGKH